MSDANQLQAFNGVNAVTGQYGLELNADQLVQRVFGNANPAEQAERQAVLKDAASSRRGPTRGVRENVDGTKLSEAGWGIIFAHAAPRIDAIKAVLQPLLTLRQQQAGQYFRIFEGVDAYRPGETKTEFLRRFGVGSGAVDPKKGVPYYLLLIGGPELIPYEFQYRLDVQFAVGRLEFDTLDEFERYAKSVVAADQGKVMLDRKATFFSVRNDDDGATEATHESLVQPLLEYLTPRLNGWTVNPILAEEATRSRLESLLGGSEKPALLFTASHGIEFPLHDPRQERYQGALLCQEWPGPKAWSGQGVLPEEFYFAGDHLSSSADPSGMISFHFACFGGGTPHYPDFGRKEETSPIAERPFVAHLPKKLLGHPRGGALAVVSHIDRAWSYSFRSIDPARQNETPQTTVFESTLERLFAGQPLGWAVEYFNNRYAELAADLNNEIDRMKWSNHLEAFELARMWTENNDARNYVILGDPAVRLAVQPELPSHTAAPFASIPLMSGGRPQNIAQADWQQTPATVQQVLTDAFRQIQSLAAQANETSEDQTHRPVLRDGGASLRGQDLSESLRRGTTRSGQLRSSPVRGGSTRSGTTRGEATRGGTTRGGTRSYTPRSHDDETDKSK